MPYYDTSSPSITTKNSITRTATDFGLRDFLLHKNIQNPIKYPQLSTSPNGGPRGGEPVLDTMVGNGSVIPHVSVEIDGLARYATAIAMNHYKDTSQSAPSLIDINYINKVPIFPTSPNGTGNYQNENITQYGLLSKTDFKQYRKTATLKNLYLDATKQIDMADFISLQPQQVNQQLTGYLDEYGNLNLGGSGAVQAADILGSVLNGQGLGLAKGGVVTNFDIRASLAGRVLTATGLLNDTKLGVIGGQQLALALANNAAFNVEQGILGSFNVTDNILSLVKNGNLAGFRPDYKITVPNNTGGKILDYSERILGFNVPKSFVPDAGSIFSSENGNIGNIERANEMLSATGKGQLKALLGNMMANLNGTSPNGYDSPDSPFSFFRSGYAPGYRNTKNELILIPKGYAFMDEDGKIFNFFNTGRRSPIPEIATNHSKMIEKYGFKDAGDTYLAGSKSSALSTTFSWGAFGPKSDTNLPINAEPNTSEFVGDKKTILRKTQLLFNSVGMKSIVSTKGDMTIGNPSQIQTAVVNGGISKGSAVMSSNNFNTDGSIKKVSSGQTADNTFCRSWTTYNRYNTVNRLIRSRGLNQSESDGSSIFPEGGRTGGWRQNIKGSVLDDNGFVKIAPYKKTEGGYEGDQLSRTASAPKKYMFSIENLAWVGTPAANLLPSEQGPGDLLTGKFGKIMWFPPYDLNFSETSSLNIESTNFIGRGEPIYTYNNTERTGQLSFKIIIDHPSIMNSFAGNNGPSDEFIRSWFAGCVDLDSIWAKKLTEEQKNTPKTQTTKKPKKKTIQPAKVPDDIYIYFENDVTQIVTDYENGNGTGVGSYTGEPQRRRAGGPLEPGDVWPDRTDFGLNVKTIKILDRAYSGWNDPNYITDLKTYLNSDNGCPTCKARCIGYASSQGVAFSNNVLAENRAKTLQKWLIDNGILDQTRIKTAVESKVLSGAYSRDTPVDNIGPKSDRYAKIVFRNDEKAKEIDDEPEIVTEEVQVSLNQQVKNKFYTESDFFEKVQREDPFVYDQFKQKIRYFHPSFHSTTPEGFNSRLTFLLQCTRQGATISGSEPRNLAFGPAPVCILRIGDFYNTKIIMDNVSFDFEPLVWDLNPEGVGVQPMIANVTISFKYIGGSSLYGPINKLQNALSFNYFANTQTFDPRADTISKVSDIKGSTLPKDRKTLFDTNKDSDPEPNYGLVMGLDSVTTSMGAISPNEVTTPPATTQQAPNVNQVTASNNATNTQVTQTNTGSTLPDISRLTLSLSYDEINKPSEIILFSIKRKKPSDITPLSSNYKLKAKIMSINGDESYEMMITDELLKENIQQDFSIVFDNTTPVCKGLNKNKKYSVKVELIGAGTLNVNIN